DALGYFEHAWSALKELPENPKRIAQQIDLCFDRRNALFSLGEFAQQREVLNEARALAEGIGDQQRLGWALGYQAHLYTFLGEHAQAIDAAEATRRIAERVSDELSLNFVANYYLGQARWFAADARSAAAPLNRAIALTENAPLGERFGMTGLAAVIARWALAQVLAEQGEFAAAIAAGQEGLEIAQSAQHRYSEVWVRYGLGYAHIRQGNFAAATRVLEPGLALCRGMDLRV